MIWTTARRFRTKARRVTNKLEWVRIKINESERKLATFDMKLGNPLISQSFENLFRNLRLRHGKIPKIVQPFEKMFRLKNWIRN